MFDLLITNGTIITLDADHTIIDQGYVAVSAGRIVALGAMSELPSTPAVREILNAAGHAVLPGFIDAHGHGGHALTKTVALGPHWTDAVEQIYYQYSTPEFWNSEARLAALEKLKFGTTTSVSMIGSVPRIGDLEAVAAHFEGAQSVGTRTVAGIGSPNPPWPKRSQKWCGNHSTVQELWPQAAYADTEAVVKQWHNTNQGKTFAFVMPSRIGIAAPNDAGLAIEQMREMRRIADLYNTRIHAHSYAGDISFTQTHFPRGLGEDVLLAHCTGIDLEEVKLLADTGTHVATGPSTNAHISARCPVIELLEAGANVVICTDGNAPDRTFDLWKDLRICQLLHRNHFHDADLLPAGTTLEMVTIRAARALGLDHLIGSLETDKRADLVLVNVQQPHLSPFFLPVEKLVQAASGQDVSTVIVDGEIVMRERTVLTVNERAVLKQARDQLELALVRSDHSVGLAYREGLWANRYQ